MNNKCSYYQILLLSYTINYLYPGTDQKLPELYPGLNLGGVLFNNRCSMVYKLRTTNYIYKFGNYMVRQIIYNTQKETSVYKRGLTWKK